MPANTDPIFTKNVIVGSVLITAANTSSQGGGTIGTDIFLIETFDATNGGFSRRVRFIPTATTATTTTATVGRLFVSTQSTGATTSANTYLLAEITLPAIPAANATNAVFWFDFRIADGIQAGMSLLVTNHAAPAANSAWRAIAFGGDY